jgi:hypothetical protein
MNSMANSLEHRRWMLLLLTLVLVALAAHLFGDVVAAASGNDLSPDARFTLSTGCLHTSALLPAAPSLPLGLLPHFELSVTPSILHGYSVPTPLRPPISACSLQASSLSRLQPLRASARRTHSANLIA